MPGTPSSTGCEACRKQKKRVSPATRGEDAAQRSHPSHANHGEWWVVRQDAAKVQPVQAPIHQLRREWRQAMEVSVFRSRASTSDSSTETESQQWQDKSRIVARPHPGHRRHSIRPPRLWRKAHPRSPPATGLQPSPRRLRVRHGRFIQISSVPAIQGGRSVPVWRSSGRDSKVDTGPCRVCRHKDAHSLRHVYLPCEYLQATICTSHIH